mmetsp:Transcript_13710/g.41406  ORF Transcript_13710/g.41406 Transcript_13710/m.41406 type:complete len:1265 (+) Transcript_13710:304-4098(+)
MSNPPEPAGPQIVLDYAGKRLAKFGAFTVVVAVLLTQTSGRFWLNLPLAAVAVGGFCLLWVQACEGAAGSGGKANGSNEGGWKHRRAASGVPGGQAAPAAKQDGMRWRDKVRAPVVEQAWETLCGSILQEFVYDAWFGCMSPDREFPAEIRRALNCAFGELAVRSRRVDPRAILKDLSDLLIETLDLFRETRDSIQQGTTGGGRGDLSLAAWDRALQREMKAEGNLHPALCTPDGHYRVLRAVSEGLTALLLDRADSRVAMIRAVARELLATAVLRNLMFYFTPYTLNKMLLGALQRQPEVKTDPELEEEQRQVSKTAKSESMRGHWDFEQRLRASVESESQSLAQGRASKKESRTRLASSSAPQRPSSATGPSAVKGSPSLGGSHLELDSWALCSAGSQHYYAPAAASQLRPPSAAAVTTTEASSPAAAAAAAAASPVAISTTSKSVAVAAAAASAAAAEPAVRPGATGAERVAAGVGQAVSAELRRRPASADAEVFATAVGQPSIATASNLRPSAGSSTAAVTPERASSHAAPPASTGAPTPGRETTATAVGRSAPATAVSSAGPASGICTTAPPAATAAAAARMQQTAAARPAGSVATRSVSPPPPPPQQMRPSSEELEDTHGFIGRPLAKVVAAELTSGGSKEVVMFIIRVADDRGEWTLARRFRHFESLHRSMRGYPAYKGRLPPKRIFFHTASAEFVEERRQLLDDYLQPLLEEPNLCRTKEVWQFLSPWSDMYDLDESGSFLRAVGTQLGTAKFNVQRFAGDIASDLDTKRKRSVAVIARSLAPPPELPPGVVLQGRSGSSKNLLTAGGGSGSTTDAVRRTNSHSPTRRRQDRADLAASRMDSISYDSKPRGASPGVTPSTALSPMPGFGANGGGMPSLAANGSHAAGGRLSRAASAKTAIPRSSSATALRDEISTSRQAMSMSAAQDTARSLLSRGGRGEPASSIPDTADSGMPRATSAAHSQQQQELRGTAVPAGAAAPAESWSDDSRPGATCNAAASCTVSPGDSPREVAGGETGGSESDTGHLECGRAAAAPPGGNVYAFHSGDVRPSSKLDVGAAAAAAEWEDSTGVSAPLYEVVDVVFELGSRGFFRRQIFTVARQALSLVAGGAIDVFLAGQLRLLRQEHTLARAIHGIQAALWPGGIWFMYRPEYPKRPIKTPEEWAMTPEKYLVDETPPPLDEDEIREALQQTLRARAPPALVSLVGRPAYSRGVQDIFDLLQSPTFLLQLGYGILEILAVSAFPELKPLFRQLERTT